SLIDGYTDFLTGHKKDEAIFKDWDVPVDVGLGDVIDMDNDKCPTRKMLDYWESVKSVVTTAEVNAEIWEVLKNIEQPQDDMLTADQRRKIVELYRIVEKVRKEDISTDLKDSLKGVQ